MFKIESYVTPILLSYVDKYVRDFRPADAQVSLWGGGVVLHNLVLKGDVLQREVSLPFTLVSGRIHELLIHVPWTKIMSEPIVVTIDTIECVLSLNPPVPGDDTPPVESPSRKAPVMEAPPGYMQALVRRIVSNIALRVHHLIVKYVQDDIVMSLNVKHLAVESAGPNWEPAFADIDQAQPLIRRLVRLDDLTLCLDKSDIDGKIRFFEEPLLYRCQMNLRVLTRLVSANTRRATSLNVQIRSSKLAWSISNEQMILLLRLLRERPVTKEQPKQAPPRQSSVAQTSLHAISSNSAEPTRQESWSEWAWSWLPTWMDREHGVEEAPVPPTPLPLFFNAYLDQVSLVFKVLEVDSNHRKRSRSVLEVSATYMAAKASVCVPTSMRVRFGVRELMIESQGKCVCGRKDADNLPNQPAVYVRRIFKSDQDKEWSWPEEDLNEKIETGEAVDETYQVSPEQSGLPEGVSVSQGPVVTRSSSETKRDKPEREEVDELWAKMSPLLYVEYVHDRSPPNQFTNPYDSPPKNFEYSDWVEKVTMSIEVEPIELLVCMGLIHRLKALNSIYREQPQPETETPRRVLTVEESEALMDNLPQKRITVEARGVHLRMLPWNHGVSDRPSPVSIALDLELPKTTAAVVAPLYPLRVCSAASQMPCDSGPLWQGARRHITVVMTAVQARVCSPADNESRPCARADVKLVTHQLLNKTYFKKRESVEFSYNLKIRELSICGSSARLQTALHVALSLFHENRSVQLKHTTLATDALNDEEAVAIDFNLEDLAMRGFLTRNINTHVVSLQSAKATAYHEPKGDKLKQAWLFSAPDAPTTTPYLRLGIQWCNKQVDNSFDYCGLWTEPLAMSIDPLLIAWLAYKPALRPESTMGAVLRSSNNSVLFTRRSTPPSSSGRGASKSASGQGAELVHLRSRSQGSSSEVSEKKEPKMPIIPIQQKPEDSWFCEDRIVKLHKRLRSMLLNIEMGLVLVYVTMSTASAIDCATLRDAMERHATESHRVLGISFGKLSVHSNAATSQLWQELRHDGPTFVKDKPNTESFPWKLCLADVSCYTLESRLPTPPSKANPEKTAPPGGLKSLLKAPLNVAPRIVLDLVTTSVTVSVVTKSIQYKSAPRKEATKKSQGVSVGERMTRYFTSGMEFKPSSLKEFVRGPTGGRKKSASSHSTMGVVPESTSEVVTITEGPVVSLGVHLHADTPPVLIRLEHDQIHIVAAAVHCFSHIHTLLNRPPVSTLRHSYSSQGLNKTFIRSVSEMDEIPSASEDTSENHSDLISIFDRNVQNRRPMHMFYWFQWVISHATVVVASDTVKLAFDIDDIISTVDLQSQYNQLKIKLASASIKHYERSNTNDWVAGMMGGRVLEAREPTNSKEDAHFLAVTITQARVANLPASWKEELHPKLLEHNSNADNVWEIFATLAPLEAVIQPAIMDNVMSLVTEMAPRAFCPLKTEIEERQGPIQWPFLYVTAGGLRLLITGEQQDKNDLDDTFIFSIGKININPHPDNPICRRAVNAGADGAWLPGSGSFEGRQYQIEVKNVSARSAKFNQLALVEKNNDYTEGTASENPALKWSNRMSMPLIVPILHTVELCCVLAPALYVGGTLTCGPAVEVNLVSDCSIELSVAQLALLQQMLKQFNEAAKRDSYSSSGYPFKSMITDKYGVCPYAALIVEHEAKNFSEKDATLAESLIESKMIFQNEWSRSVTCDSGVETVASSSKCKITDDGPIRKTASVAFVDQIPSHFLEVFVTMGVIDLSLYVADDGSPEVIALRPPHVEPPVVAENSPSDNTDDEKQTKTQGLHSNDSTGQQDGSHSLTELMREDGGIGGQAQMEIPDMRARKFLGNVSLLQITLFQPNLYYWKRKTQKTLQLSIFNTWVALGVGDIPGQWHAVLMATAKGVPDPVTDIRPALATLKVVIPVAPNFPTTTGTSTSARGTVSLDIERPVQFDMSTDKLRRLKGIYELLTDKVFRPEPVRRQTPKVPLLYKWRKYLIYESMESITIQTSQVSVCGPLGTLGWDSSSLQMSAGNRPERLNARGLISALLMSAGPPGDRRHVVLQPLMLGMELEVFWEAWRRAEGGLSATEPTVKVGVEVDRVTIDLRPSDLSACNRLRKSLNELLKKPPRPFVHACTSEANYKSPLVSLYTPTSSTFAQGTSPMSSEQDAADQLYKDDLRSGAFKILSGGQLPMAYQVMLHGNAVSWRYPHPRAITRVVAFPLPGQDEEIDCVLELYVPMLGRWEPHTYFKIPVGEPRELNLHVPPPDCVFAMMWRFRVCAVVEPVPPPYRFMSKKFLPRIDPLNIEHPEEPPNVKCTSEVTAEQLSGVLRVDSFFAPRLLPRTKIIVRVANLEVHAHNSLPYLSSQATYLEGYYVSKPLMRTHRVLSISARDTTMHAHVDSPAGILYLMDTKLSSDIVDCATGAMEGLVEEFRLQGGISDSKASPVGPRARLMTAGIHVVLQVPRLKTLQSLFNDWNAACVQYVNESGSTFDYEMKTEKPPASKRDVAAAAAVALEGRVSLWVHNSCASAMKIGQEGTDEVVPLGPGARLAYRWRSPSAPKKFRLALAGPSTDWHWSTSLPFVPGSTRLRIDSLDSQNSKQFPGVGSVIHVRIEELGASKYMQLSGRLVLANMLRANLLYKVKSHGHDTSHWRTVCSGELSAETVGRSVVCSAECELVLKIRFRAMNTGWSGDIPLKECPKENVPWLVKVPSDGEGQFVSVWCRVVRARSDGRILATMWPLYVLHSHLPLDTDVLIITESTTTTSEDLTPVQLRPPPLLQTTPGRGTSTHLRATGTTSARHTLSFQYRNIECPVTREAVPLHYGVTETSVFDKGAPVSQIEDVIKEILRWLDRSGRNVASGWPYSLVTKHWYGTWQAASLQPRCDVTVRYQPVRAGGGCSLEIMLSPVALLCNATPIALTLRAYDAAPLCRLDPGTAISPPSSVLEKPFFMSVEIGRETFVSGQLQVSTEEPGRYGAPPPGHVALDHAAHFSILCNQKVALLTLYYEIKEQINILGVSSSYVLINRLDTDILVSAISVPNDTEKGTTLRPKTFKVVPPSKDKSVHGTSLCRFWLHSRWRGGDPTELNNYLCLSLHSHGTSHSVRESVPIRLGEPPVRRAIGLLDSSSKSIPIVVTQIKHDSRWLVVVANDPCPQFLVHNHTRLTLAVAQSLHYADKPSTSKTANASECAGAHWWCKVPPESAIHYSTPEYCARFPPDVPAPLSVTSPDMPFLTFAKGKDEKDLEWCSPVVVADGEQLLQYSNVTIKLRVRNHPHTTLLELQDVDHNDISASDIRRRLFSAFSSDREAIETAKLAGPSRVASLERVDADAGLLQGVSKDKLVPLDTAALSEITMKDFYATDQGKTLPEADADESILNLPADTAQTQPGSKAKKNSDPVLFAELAKGPDFHEPSPEHLGVTATRSDFMCRASDAFMSEAALRIQNVDADLGDLDPSWAACERFRCVVAGVAVEMAASSDVLPLFMLHLDRSALLVLADKKTTKTILSIADAQIDNLQYDTGQYDFAVVASTRAEALEPDQWPPLWSMFAGKNTFATRQDSARLLLKLQHDKWQVVNKYKYRELTEVEIKLGTLALYVEDAYVKALVELSRLMVPSATSSSGGAIVEPVVLGEERSLQAPLRLRLLHVHPLDLTLTLHTAVRMYIALDQSPLRLSAFRLHDMLTSADRLTHALTVHYLSAAILGAGWVVGGLELLGAPGALAARLGGATGGVRGVASAAAAALLRSLSAWAGSLARNLDLLAGDEEHARRAAAARRRSPPSFVAGLIAGITNFAINILGAVGGLAHHPLVGVAVGETESGATALRRGILGALTKPLSATADLVAYAGTGLLKQTGWDPVPEPRRCMSAIETRDQASWHRDCVRWMFRLCELTAFSGFEVLLDNTPLQLLLTHKFLVVVEPETERIVEMIDLKYCTLGPYEGQVIELSVTQRRQQKQTEFRLASDEDDEYQISVAAMARVARYTGAEGSTQGEVRVLSLLPRPGRSHSLHAALAAAVHHNADSHFPML